MNNVLVSIIGGDTSQVDIENIYKKFEEEGYYIEIFHDTESNFNLDTLPTIIEYIKNQDRYHKGINKIVVVSNIKSLLLTWYRLYNHLVNDFILLLDFVEVNSAIDPIEKLIIEKLSSFSNIHDDKLIGKIYLNIDIKNYQKIIGFLMQNQNFIYFDDFKNYNFSNEITKKLVNKVYKVGNYKIDINNNENGEKIYIDTNIPLNSIVNIDKEFIHKAAESPWFLFYFSYYIYKVHHDTSQKKMILNYLFDSNLKNEYKLEISNYVQKYVIDSDTHDFKDKVAFISLLIKLGHDKKLMKKMIEILKDDDKNIEYHVPILTNTLGYITRNNQEKYPQLFKDRIFIMKRVNEYYKRFFNIKKTERNEKRIAIVVGQLLTTNHSPTQWAINYANNLKKYYPDYEIKIFVEDMFNYSPGELFWPYSFSSVNSAALAGEHEKLLNKKIKVHYSDSTLQRVHRIERDIKAILEFNPNIIFKIGCAYSITVDLLYDYFPIVSMTLAGAEDSIFVDIYTGGYPKELITNFYEEQGIKNRDYIQHTVGIQDPISHVKKEREEYELQANDFVMITVGNRLSAEMSNDFIDTVCSFLNDYVDAKWLIVGLEKHQYIETHYRNLILSKQIIFIPYEQYLFDLYKICDVYINPFRQGGGNSGAMAMKARLPVVSIKGPYDVSVFVGEEDCVEKNKYKDELVKLYRDNKYRLEKGQKMFKRIQENFSFENTVNELMIIFQKAVKKFQDRTKC